MKHRTSNIEQRTPNVENLRHSMFSVQCSLFSVFGFLISILMMTSACKNVESRSPDFSQLQWEKLPSIPDPEGFAGAFAGSHNDALIIAGGANIVGDKWGKDFKKVWYDSVFILEKTDDAWRTGFKLPHPLGYGVSISTDKGIICIGGSDANRHYSDVFRLAWRNGKIDFTPLPNLPKPCANFCGAKIGNAIYVAGGIENPNSTSALKTFWKLDLNAANPRWEELEPWPGSGRMLAVAGVFRGSFYLFSGAKLETGADGKPAREYLRDAYRYTPGKGWERLADLPWATVAAPSPAVAFGKELLIFTGDDGTKTDFQPISQHPGFSRQAMAFNAEGNFWSAKGEVPFSRATTPVVEWRGHIVVPNGESRPRERTPEVWWAKIQTESIGR